MSVLASEIAEFLKKELLGPDLLVQAPSTVQELTPGRIAFAKDESRLPKVAFEDGVLIIAPRTGGRTDLSFILSENPRSEFARILEKFFPSADGLPGIHPTAIVDPSASIHPSASVGPYCVIGRDSKIGKGSVLESQAVLGDRVTIGRFCKIGCHTVIGKAGFGIEHDEAGMPFRIPHSGGVVIDDFVQIGNLVSIAQGTMSPTLVEHHVMIDDHVFVAHNVRIRYGALIIAGAEISGSVDIGAHAWIAPQVTIRNGLVIGERAVVGIGSVVVRDVPKDSTVMGNPAKQR
jgi:UDP-3-O-[3-hydroxymyristoyl] glucosamine N-acyltransferase